MPSEKTNCFVDTDVLVYAIDPEEPEKRAIAADLLRAIIRNRTLVLSAQSLNECYRVITTRRQLMPNEEARGFIASLSPFCTAPEGFAVTRRAWDVQDATGYAWWDCLLLASALRADCGVFMSEDLQHRRHLDDLTIMNPFVQA